MEDTLSVATEIGSWDGVWQPATASKASSKYLQTRSMNLIVLRRALHSSFCP
jgi:hypothetical protein